MKVLYIYGRHTSEPLIFEGHLLSGQEPTARILSLTESQRLGYDTFHVVPRADTIPATKTAEDKMIQTATQKMEFHTRIKAIEAMLWRAAEESSPFERLLDAASMIDELVDDLNFEGQGEAWQQNDGQTY